MGERFFRKNKDVLNRTNILRRLYNKFVDVFQITLASLFEYQQMHIRTSNFRIIRLKGFDVHEDWRKLEANPENTISRAIHLNGNEVYIRVLRGVLNINSSSYNGYNYNYAY